MGSAKGNLTEQAGKTLPYIKRLLLTTLKFITIFIIVGGIVGLVWYYMGWMFVIQLVLVAIVAYLAAGGGYHWLFIFYRTVLRDLT